MTSKSIMLVLSAVSLVSCGASSSTEGFSLSSSPAASSEVSTIEASSSGEEVKKQVTFFDGDTVLYTVPIVNGSVKDPGTPYKKNFVFDGWEDKDGNLYDFEDVPPTELYARWVIFDELSDVEKLSKYINRIVELCPIVSETRGYIETAYQWAIVEGVYTSIDVFAARRYDDWIVITDHYYPKVCYINADLSEEEQRLGLTIDDVNAKNHTLTVQETYEGGDLTTIYDYNEAHANYDINNEDGKIVESVKGDAIDTRLKIDFASYFMGWANQLLVLMQYGWGLIPYEVYDEESEFDGNFYYIKPLNVSLINPREVGFSFSFAYAYTYEGSSGNYVTNLYESEGSVAFVDGKIRHCQVEKTLMNFIDGEATYYEASLSAFDFDSVDDYPEYQGELLDPKNYDLYED